MLNGQKVQVDAPGDLSVLWALRDKLGLTGPKYGCGINVCKACTSHLDGKSFNPFVTNVRDVACREVTTIEGLADGDNLHPVQEAWLEQDVAQCGYCQPGQIMAAVALLKRTSNPTDEDIDAIQAAAAKMATPVAGPAGGAAGIPDTVPDQLPATGVDPKTAAAAVAALGAAAATHLLAEFRREDPEHA